MIPLLLALAGVACSGGSGGSFGGDGSQFTASFLPDQPAPPAQTVSAAEGSSDGQFVTVSIEVTGAQDVFAALFEVTVPAGVVYVDWDPGTLLESGGNQATYFVTQPDAGRVRVDAARLGGTGVDVSGSRTLVRLTFRAVQTGDFTLAFDEAELYDDGPPQPLPIGGLTWYGGTILAE
jgi:hypothetical protein